MSDWTNSLERDIEVAEGQIALALMLPEPMKAFIHIEVERLKRIVAAAKTTIKEQGDVE